MRYLALLLLFVAGCGYQFTGGLLPGNVQRLFIPIAQNKTTEPLIATVLAVPVTAVLARQKGIDIVENQERSDAILQGVVTKYEVEPISYDSNDRISVFRATLVVKYKLTHAIDGRLLWQGTFNRQENYGAAVDKNQQEDLESLAIAAMSKNIADDLLARLVANF